MSIKNKALVIVASALIGVSSAASAKVDGPMVMTIEEVGASELLSWSWTASQSISYSTGSGGGGTGKVNIGELNVTRYSDAQSAALLRYIVTGSHFDTVEFARDGLKITLKDVLISSFNVGSSSDMKEPQTESLSFSFRQITYQVDGGPAYCYDRSTNTQC
ncbi:type VI secretion system tube protein Hcp [Vibrio sp. EA2]|uniref:type VI secretion system tube protein Hcp n=1 Tax=Vibrio sp. EA2 TaxID=3079860 RepID=UPI00294A2F12|nr:type VI secretion system tube protein Hcp [Vibrio sp. EA2]MDV6250560.1 type VI secretion system tube protein Hcp [Vibrio sp. EA2]